MTATSTAQKTAVTLFAATMALGLAACGSSATSDAPKPAPALVKTAQSTAPHDFAHEPRCFPASPCPR